MKLLLLQLPLLILLLSGCVERNPYLLDVRNLYLGVIVEDLDTSPEKPLKLCGNEDLVRLLEVLRCANQEKFYGSGYEGLEHRDESFEARSPEGYRVLKFDGACGEKAFSIYMTTDACDEVQSYQPYEEAGPEVLNR